MQDLFPLSLCILPACPVNYQLSPSDRFLSPLALVYPAASLTKEIRLNDFPISVALAVLAYQNTLFG